MEVFRDADGDINYDPIDFFPGAVAVEDWIKEKISDDDKEHGPEDYQVDRIIYRADLYSRAKAEYIRVSGNRDLREMRGYPLVVTNYDYGTDTVPYVSYWFLFKEDNNGTTYKIFHKPEDKEYN